MSGLNDHVKSVNDGIRRMTDMLNSTNQSQAGNHDLRGSQPKEKGGAPEDARQGVDMLNIAEERNVSKQSRPHFKKTPANISRAPTWSEVVLVTPFEARRLRTEAIFERQRNISKSNVERLAAEMTARRFTPGTQVYVCILPDGRELVINGNHTLEAVCLSGVSQLLTVTRHHVADIDEAGEIYAVFDIQRIRSWKDSLKATGKGDDIPDARRVLSSVGLIENGFNAKQVGAASRIERLNMLGHYREPAILFNEVVKGKKGSTDLIKRAAVMAVALETLRYQPSMAVEFWSRIAQDNGLTDGMPEKALLNWLRNNRTTGEQGRRENLHAAALAWNAAFRGDERAKVKPNAMRVFYLLGTPWAAGSGEVSE